MKLTNIIDDFKYSIDCLKQYKSESEVDNIVLSTIAISIERLVKRLEDFIE